MVSAILSIELMDSLSCGSAPHLWCNPRSRKAGTAFTFIAGHTGQAAQHVTVIPQSKNQ